MTFIQELQARGLIAQASDLEQIQQLLSQPQSVYCGFDPTAGSLHIGHLVPLIMLKRFQDAGHQALALIGGATGMIGDPSFKAVERNLNTEEVVANWVKGLTTQIDKLLTPHLGQPMTIVNNADWMKDINIIDFFRDVGKHFSVNNMISRESVKQRLQRPEQGISFTEFSYSLLQSYDFALLNRNLGCCLQIGGNDQWGNIVSGIDLTRRQNGEQVFGLTLPLITKSDGTKFGKTESGTIWLDSSKTSPYAFYQFWLNTADADVYSFLRYFTFLSIEKIEEIEKHDAEIQGRKTAQAILADEVTRIVHGEGALQSAKRITEALFAGDLAALTEQELEQIKLDGLPASDLVLADIAETPLTTLFADCGLVKAGREVKDALGRNAVLINGEAKGAEDNMNTAQSFAAEKALFGRFFLVKLGKKKHHLFEIK